MKDLFLIICFLLIAGDAYALRSFEDIRGSYKKSDSVLLDRHGKVIHELRVDSKGRRLEWVSIKDISPALITAVIISEDQRFYDHRGVDWIAAATASLNNIFSRTSRGASTITMQLASVLEKKLRPKAGKRTLSQKWSQMEAARQLEKTWTKDQILEAYLNLITYKGELQGVHSASMGLFDKKPSGLNNEESVILAALIRSPNASLDKAVKRACLLGKSMKTGPACEDISRLAQKTFSRPYYIRQKVSLAPHVARIVLKDTTMSETTTLDGALQLFVFESLRNQLMTLRSKNVGYGAALVIDNKTGDVLAYVTGSAEPAVPEVDGVQARRQAGSTLKPFLYALAFEKKILTPASILSDSPLDVPTAKGIYKPENYESDFKGTVSARSALASSLNIPAVRTLSLTGVADFIEKLRLLGLTGLESDEHYGPSLALGSADVSLYELTNAYRALANNGSWSQMSITPSKKRGPARRAYSAGASFLVSDILSDREARSGTFSLENPLSTRFWSAVKTGTSKDMRDNWCIGYSKRYTVGVWVGNYSGAPMWNVSGITGAAPVWLEIMNHLHKNRTDARPDPPGSLIAQKIEFGNQIEPRRTEWFIRDTEPSIIEKGSHNNGPKISYPVNRTIIALDPDIPDEQQLIFFETEPSADNMTFVLDSITLGDAAGPVSWRPKAGDHRIMLVTEGNKVSDVVEFSVRGR